MSERFNDSVRDRFMRYTAYDTMSDPAFAGKRRPTTEGQEILLLALRKELEELGLETYYGEEKILKGTLPGNSGTSAIAFMAHVDTADDCQGNGVKAVLHTDYDGKDIILSEDQVIKVEDDKDILRYVGGEIITSDGTTLLGSDDKAGVAIIMEAVKFLVEHPEVKRPTVEVYFTPDEETGCGMDSFPMDKLESSCCYTVDGGTEGWIENECFNAGCVDITVKGVSIHLGSARGVMVNALTILSHIVSALPQAESPEATDGRYGYYCPLSMGGTATEANLKIFIRDFDSEAFSARMKHTEDLVRAFAAIYRGKAEIESSVTYRNMAEANHSRPEATEAIYSAAGKLGFDLVDKVIRGGTDGARLAERGIPCPNLFTGGHNLHSEKEWVSVTAMGNCVDLVLGICEYWSER